MKFTRVSVYLIPILLLVCFGSFTGCQKTNTETYKADAEGIQGTKPSLASFTVIAVTDTSLKVDIAGTNFRPGAKVEIKKIPCIDVQVLDSTFLTCTLQSVFEFALIDILVTNSDGNYNEPFTVPPGGSAEPTFAYHTVFVTSSNFSSGNLGGLGGADSVCADLASREESVVRSQPGKWKAILSSNSADARDRIVLKSSVPIRDPQGQMILSDASNLWGANLNRAIAKDEKGSAVAEGTRVWTGTLAHGRSALQHCSGFTSAQSSANGKLGQVGPVNSNWLSDVTNTCDPGGQANIRIYCLNSNE